MSLAPDPTLDDTGTGSPDDLAHYARKEDIARAAVDGTLVVALCGVRFQPVRDPDRFPTCERCVALLGQIDAARMGSN